MNSFDNQRHSDEFLPFEPTADDWAEYNAYLDGELEQDFEDANRELQEVDLDDEPDFDEDYYHDYPEYYDGQPSEYEEWQDLYGGDDWDHGQYDDYDEWN